MKRNFYILILSAFVLNSCLPDPYPPDYIGPRFVIGTAEKEGSTSFITTDDPYKVLLKKGNFPDSIVGLRVYSEGIFYESSGNFDYAFELGQSWIVPIKSIQFADNQQTINSANNASVAINQNILWQSGRYFNFRLLYYAADLQKHSFEFFVNENTGFEENRVTIYICHYNNGDNVALNARESIYSLDLTDLFDRFTEKFDIRFVYTENSQQKDFIISNIEKK